MSPKMKRGWFTRLARKHLHQEWEEQAKKLEQVDRWKSRSAAWESLQQAGGLSLEKIIHMFHERFTMAEVVVLKSNQKALHNAIKAYREDLAKVPAQQSFPGFEKKMAAHFRPIADYWVKDPGPDRKFDKLRRIGELDFAMQYNMSQVREEQSREVMLSKEDYEFMEVRRQAEGLPETTTIRQIIDRAA